MNNAGWKSMALGALLMAAAMTAQAAPADTAKSTTAKAHAAVAAQGLPKMPRFRFENFTTENGLPDNHIFSVLVDGGRIWAGTENGLAVYEGHKWKTGASRGAFSGAGCEDGRCLGWDDGRVEPRFWGTD